MIQPYLTIVNFLRLIGSTMGAGAPNRQLPPTPDEDANERTLIMKRVSLALSIAFSLSVNNYSTPPSPPTPLKQNKSSTRGTVETGQGDGHFDLNVGYFRSLFSLSPLTFALECLVFSPLFCLYRRYVPFNFAADFPYRTQTGNLPRFYFITFLRFPLKYS